MTVDTSTTDTVLVAELRGQAVDQVNEQLAELLNTAADRIERLGGPLPWPAPTRVTVDVSIRRDGQHCDPDEIGEVLRVAFAGMLRNIDRI